MPRDPHNRALTNETENPYVVEITLPSDGLDAGLSRDIMRFHKSRHIEPRYGRRITTGRGKVCYRWCFSDLLIARDFAEQFNGEFCKPGFGIATK
jgi:hypothetical protein